MVALALNSLCRSGIDISQASFSAGILGKRLTILAARTPSELDFRPPELLGVIVEAMMIGYVLELDGTKLYPTANEYRIQNKLLIFVETKFRSTNAAATCANRTYLFSVLPERFPKK